MRKRDLALSLLTTISACSLAQADGELPGICVSSRQPVHVYLNSTLVCENSLNCAILHLRPSSAYHIEVRDPFDAKARPLFSDHVRTPERSIQTVVVQGGTSIASHAVKTDGDGAGMLSGKTMAYGQTDAQQQGRPKKVDFVSPKNPLISEDEFAKFMLALGNATPEQMKWLIEGRITQNAFRVQHVKQIVEQHASTDELRFTLIKKMYGAVADRENAFQLINVIYSGELQGNLASYMADYNAAHPL